MGWISSLPFIVSIGSGFLGGYIIDKIQKKNIVFLFLVGGLMTALFVTIAITAKSPLVSAFCLILANAFWGIQGPAIPTLVQNLSDPRSVGSTYGIVNGIGNLVSAFMPAIMGVFIGGSGNVSFTAGFSLLIGTQLVTAICGILFYFTKVNKQMNHSTY
jgi:MFS family permease